LKIYFLSFPSFSKFSKTRLLSQLPKALDIGKNQGMFWQEIQSCEVPDVGEKLVAESAPDS
jgi:hypothetical protein